MRNCSNNDLVDWFLLSKSNSAYKDSFLRGKLLSREHIISQTENGLAGLGPRGLAAQGQEYKTNPDRQKQTIGINEYVDIKLR